MGGAFSFVQFSFHATIKVSKILEEMLMPQDHAQLLETLKERFAQFPERHSNIKWEEVERRLVASPDKMGILAKMEATGGEPDVVGYDEKKDAFLFFDCAKESPKARRSCCYDQAALEARKKHKPETSAQELAKEMGIELLTEADYEYLQALNEVDLKTSSWIQTPDAVRERGGALFGSRRYDRVFIYCNGADSYYSVRGFRGKLAI